MILAHYGTPQLRDPGDSTRTVHYDRLREPIEMIRPHPNLFAELAALLSGIYALLHRYTHSDNPIKREQLKWVVFSIAFAVAVGLGGNIFLTFFEKANPPGGLSQIVNMIIQTLSVLAQLSVPAAMVFSILRYRLYDIELVINRSLIYGTLAVFLAVVFGAVLLGLDAVFQALTRRDNRPAMSIVTATVAVFSLFKPTLKRLTSFVNKKIFGIEVDISDVQRVNAKLERASHLSSLVITSVALWVSCRRLTASVVRNGKGQSD